MRLALTFVASLALAAAGCASSRTTFSGEPRYGKGAEDDYKAGLEELKDKNYDLAAKFFDHVKNRYPFSKDATAAELLSADCKFEQKKYVEAADAYQNFAKLHPSHEKADYAQFRAGFAYYKDVPGDFFIFPPSYERDLKQVRTALARMDDFVKSHPGSKYLPEAEKALNELKNRLAEHDWYVAQFYAKRHRWAGAAGRFEGLIQDYPGSEHEIEAMLDLAQVYLQMNERFRAQKTLQQFILKYPKDSRRGEAEKLLASIR